MECAVGSKAGSKIPNAVGGDFHQTKLVDPARAERLWLAIAVATLWVLSVGGEADANLPVSGLETLPPTHTARRTATNRSRPRMLSCFARGLLIIVGSLMRGDGLVVGRFVPELWPSSPPVRAKPTKKKPGGIPLSRPLDEKPTVERTTMGSAA